MRSHGPRRKNIAGTSEARRWQPRFLQAAHGQNAQRLYRRDCGVLSLVRRTRIPRKPLKGLQQFHATPITYRRALLPDEIRNLIQNADAAHALIYELAIFTGLRAGEIEQLRISDLDAARSVIVLRAEVTKNRRGGLQFVPTRLAGRLADCATGRDETAPLIETKFAHNAARILYRDFARANIQPKVLGCKADFHALRHSYVSLLHEAGASFEEARILARRRLCPSRRKSPLIPFRLHNKNHIHHRPITARSIARASPQRAHFPHISLSQITQCIVFSVVIKRRGRDSNPRYVVRRTRP